MKLHRLFSTHPGSEAGGDGSVRPSLRETIFRAGAGIGALLVADDAALASRALPSADPASSGVVSPMAARNLALSEEPLFMVERDGLLVVEPGAFVDGAIQLVPPGREGAVFLHPEGQLSFDPRTPPENLLDQSA